MCLKSLPCRIANLARRLKRRLVASGTQYTCRRCIEFRISVHGGMSGGGPDLIGHLLHKVTVAKLYI